MCPCYMQNTVQNLTTVCYAKIAACHTSGGRLAHLLELVTPNVLCGPYSAKNVVEFKPLQSRGMNSPYSMLPS